MMLSQPCLFLDPLYFYIGLLDLSILFKAFVSFFILGSTCLIFPPPCFILLVVCFLVTTYLTSFLFYANSFLYIFYDYLNFIASDMPIIYNNFYLQCPLLY